MNVRFNPNKIKFLLEQQGKPRPTDDQLAEMLNVKVSTIQRWKRDGVPLFDKIFATGLRLETFLKLDNEFICLGFGMSEASAYKWNHGRPKILLKLQKFLNETGIKFEDIYK